MKTNFCLFALIFVSFTVYSQGSRVPKAVKDSLNKHYPQVTEIKWNKEGSTEFEASFKEDGKNKSVVLDKKGNIKETETAILSTELPKEAALYVEKNYPGFRMTEAARIIDSKGNIVFEAEITKKNIKKDLLFDSDGRYLKGK